MSHLSPERRSLYSLIALACVAFLIVSFSLCGLVGQMMPVSAAALTASAGRNQGMRPPPSPTKCPIRKCPTPTPTFTPTPTPPFTPTPTPTFSPTPTFTPSPTPSPTATPTVGNTTPGTTPTSTQPGAGTPLPGSTSTAPVNGNGTVAASTPTTQVTQTIGNGNPPPGGSDNGNTPGGGSPGGLFTTVALVLGVLAFLLYLLPQGGASRSILNKLLSLLLPGSVIRRLDEE